ncbi:tRNA(His) guanylyltransferase Thg1 family protein [Clostridium sp. HBUAS56010]|uniref:tRNA(His) guanylyltransferase Thg1 family protein n=1 Tax=Clostridium sp. HBUAS56010 TaxID=2571127 RepID=UPI00117733A8|nr:tRNA(His) guanylyltransferase Thg1 family protein [Clostridium sp. HBUAS56010]
MNLRDDLGNRMKQYEQVPKSKLIKRLPVIIRVDGKAFHTFTRGFKKPFDDLLIKIMQETTKYLCENIQGCVLGYTQSDEITLVLIDYKELNSSSWFDSEVQKICSVSASMATMAFNRIYREIINRNYNTEKVICKGNTGNTEKADIKYRMYSAVFDKAMFDSRCFNIPKEEVTNNVFWRQLDASRNSIQALAQANFSHKQLQNKSCNDLQDMLMETKGINWNDLPTYKKRGSCVVKNKIVLGTNGKLDWCKLRDIKQPDSAWIVDYDIPIFKGEGRDYIEQLICY